jgi:cyclophilin family peptidyl-prolyl cis-trans isomerase
MARTDNPDSATSEFFINVVDNAFLNPSPRGPGYTVFGHVVEGMDVVDRIKNVPTRPEGEGTTPVDPPVIVTAQRSK